MSKIKDDYKLVFGTTEGQKVLSHICREAGVLRPSFVPGNDAMTTAFLEGQRNVALMILTALDETPERFSQLAQELQHNV